MPEVGLLQRLLQLPTAELERQIALRYEEGLAETVRRLHAPSGPPGVAPEGILIHPRPPAHPPTPGEGESPEELAAHGRQVVEAMLESVRSEVCEDWRATPAGFRTGTSAVPRLARHFTRVEPPDELFLAAACWIWRSGLDRVCSGTVGK